MGCSPASTCRAALDEATKRWPGRDRSSDGICASSAHHAQNPHSDHETGNAFDLSNDPAHGVVAASIADWLRLEVLAGRENRVKYIISAGRIFNPSISPNWRKYNGSNGHYHHFHVSILASARNSTKKWWAGFGTVEEDEMLTVFRTPDKKVWVALGPFKVQFPNQATLKAQGFDYGKVKNVKADDPLALLKTLKP